MNKCTSIICLFWSVVYIFPPALEYIFKPFDDFFIAICQSSLNTRYVFSFVNQLPYLISLIFMEKMGFRCQKYFHLFYKYQLRFVPSFHYFITYCFFRISLYIVVITSIEFGMAVPLIFHMIGLDSLGSRCMSFLFLVVTLSDIFSLFQLQFCYCSPHFYLNCRNVLFGVRGLSWQFLHVLLWCVFQYCKDDIDYEIVTINLIINSSKLQIQVLSLHAL